MAVQEAALGRRPARHGRVRFAVAPPNLQTAGPLAYPTAPDFCMLSLVRRGMTPPPGSACSQ
jgi:hypothetical protein